MLWLAAALNKSKINTIKKIKWKWEQAYDDGTEEQNKNKLSEVKKQKQNLRTIDNLVEDKKKAPEKGFSLSISESGFSKIYNSRVWCNDLFYFYCFQIFTPIICHHKKI